MDSQQKQKLGKGARTTINLAPLCRVLVRRCTTHLLLGSLNSARVHTAVALSLLKAQIARVAQSECQRILMRRQQLSQRCCREKKSNCSAERVRLKSVGSVIDARHRPNVDAVVMHHASWSVLMHNLSDFDSLCGSMHLHAR